MIATRLGSTLIAAGLLAGQPPGAWGAAPELRLAMESPGHVAPAYYYRGLYYPYRRNGHYYHYQYHRRYCNHRAYRYGGWHCL